MRARLLDDVKLQGLRAESSSLTVHRDLERGGCGGICIPASYIWVVVLVIGHVPCFGYDYGDGKDGC